MLRGRQGDWLSERLERPVVSGLSEMRIKLTKGINHATLLRGSGHFSADRIVRKRGLLMKKLFGLFIALLLTISIAATASASTILLRAGLNGGVWPE
jgi:hypothetical protein